MSEEIDYSNLPEFPQRYEDDTGELPVSILIRYARLVNLPLENLVEDDRDLWFGHRVN